MRPTAPLGVSYGVETKSRNFGFTFRYGWFPEDAEGLQRARFSCAKALEQTVFSDGSGPLLYEDARVVRCETKIEVIEP